MYKKLLSILKPVSKSLLLIGLVVTLVFSSADGALAARSGGRIGGGSFRAPSRTYVRPSTPYRSPSSNYYPGGGGFGFPFLLPIFGIGGGFGGLFTILIFLGIANFLVQSFRRAGAGDEMEGTYDANPQVSVARVQVGLLAQARTLQADLDRIAQNANTGSSEGLAQVLQETTLALLRHPEYWIYAGTESQQTRLAAAESQFNRLALAERSKFGEETLTNVNNQQQLKSAKSSAALTLAEQGGALAQSEGPGEYIVVTLLVGAQGKLELPKVNSTDDLRRALSQIGAVPSEKLLAVEILWSPQASGDVLTSDDMMAEYPNLKLV